MKKGKKEKHFIQKASYEGGMEAMKKFIGEHMVYPIEAKENEIQGVVTVKFTINHKGKVIEAKAIRKLGYGCDEEALRLVKLLKFKIPKNKGLKVLFHKDLNIHFSMPNTTIKTVKFPQEIQYQYTQKQKTTSTPKEKKSTGYTYTINI